MTQGKYILCLVLFATLLRLVVLVAYQPWSEDWQSRYLGADPHSYWIIAHNLLQHGSITLSPAPPYMPDSQRPPVYPIFLASIIALFGSKAWPVCIVQCLLGAGAVFILYRTAQLAFNEMVARAAALCAAIDPYMIEFGCLLWSDFLFVTILTAILFLVAVILKFEEQNRSTHWVWLGLGSLLGLAVLARPVSQYLLPLFLVLVLALQRTKLAFVRLRIIALVLLVIGWGIVTSPWIVRNYRAFGSFGFTSIKGANLLFYEGADVLVRVRGITRYEAKKELYSTHWREYDGKNNFKWDTYYVSEALKIFKAHPVDTLIVHFQGMLRMFRRVDGILWRESAAKGWAIPRYMEAFLQGGPIGLFRYLRHDVDPIDAFFFVWHLLFLAFLYACILLSVFSYRRLPLTAKMMFWFLWLWIFYFNFLSAVPGGVRYRLPLHPAMAILAGVGFWHLKTAVWPKRSAVPCSSAP